MPAHPVTALRVPSRGAAPTPAPPVVALRGLVLRGDQPPGGAGALELELAAGERLVLLGPADAGKSRLLEVLAGFAAPPGGDVLLDGRAAAGLKPHLRGVGLVLPEDGPLAGMTVAGTIGFALAARGAAAEAAVALLRGFGLADVAERRAGDLRPAQLVRTALARALAGRPRLLLLDEPFARLDPEERDAVLGDLEAVLRASGAAAILATRDPALALAWGGRGVVMAEGAALQAGPVQTLYDAPAGARVARLLGEANCLPGRVERVEDGIATVRLACGLAVEADAAGHAAGQACLVFVRPERIAVAAGAAAEMGEGALPATVAGLDWRGAHVRVTLELGESGGRPATLLVTRPAGAPLAGIAPRGAAAVAWQPLHARVLPAGSVAPSIGR